MSRSTFVPRPGWTRELVRQPKAVSATHETAQRLSDEIRANVPVVTGQLLEDYGPMEPELVLKEGMPTWQVPLGTSLWHLIEFGSIHNEAYAPVRKAADAAGLDFDSGGSG